MNTIHSLFISKQKATYNEKNKSLKQFITIDFESNSSTFNDQPSQESNYIWLLKKLDVLSQALRNKKTELFRSNS